MKPDDARLLTDQRYELLQQLEDWLEVPMLVLGFVWLLLLLVELIWGLSPLLEAFGTAIWGVFIIDFATKFALAPHRLTYLRRNWLTAVALVAPALRIFRLARVGRLLRAGRATRGVRLVRIVTSLNRGMKALGATMGRRGFGYVTLLSAVVILAGAAGMFAFENEVPGGLTSYGAALWWTAMLLTSLGSEYWPRTAEGRLLCFLLALYGFAVFGYFTATLATFFIGRDAENDEAELASTRSIEALRRDLTQQIERLRSELRVQPGGEVRNPAE